MALVEGEHLRGEVARPAQLEQRHAAAGFDQQHRDAAVVDRHPQPAAGVELERAAHEVSATRECEYKLISARVDKIISTRGGRRW